ncbi:MAG: hypothetical protein LBD53_00700 [Tannerella sp.]|jgi:hypothetical protein|nr:hypothetical protein [Tannerella sp.]
MKKILILTIGALLLFSGTGKAQPSHQKDMIGITPVISDELDFHPSVKSVLDKKTRQILTMNGIAEVTERFVLVPNITLLSKTVTPTAPPMYAMEIDISFFVVDPIEGVIFNEISFTEKVVEKQENKAYIQAINKVNPRSSEARAFVEAAKRKIIDYYRTHLTAIIGEAKGLAAQKKYDEALSRLASIPAGIEGYQAVGDIVVSICRQRYNSEADRLMNEARGHITLKQYSDAIDLLVQVEPLSERFGEASKLITQVQNTIEARERAALSRQMAIHKEKQETALRIHDDKVMLTAKSIDAARDIGVAQARNQQPTIIQRVNIWFKSKFGRR